MRNLKKVLALVLSMVMALSMVTMASAYTATPGTSFKDDAAITEFDEAIQVLKGLKVLQGREDGRLDPNAVITRAEAATIIYRAITGDVDGSDLPMFADDQFSDVKVTDWYSGAVSYAANHGIIKGYTDGTFRPNDSVTGYQAMAILLRSLGYDNGNNFTGDNWQTETARYGTLTGVSNTVNNAALRLPATRAVVAELTFRSIAKVSTVRSNAFGNNEPTNVTKGYEIFGLYGDPTVEKVEGSTTGAVGHIKQMTTIVPLTGATAYTTQALEKMTTRKDAEIDLMVEKYGAPVAKWYIDSDRNGSYVDGDVENTVGSDVRKSNVVGNTTCDTEIPVLFNPVETYTTSVTTGVVYADAVKAGARSVSSVVTLYSNDVVDHGHVVDGVVQELAISNGAGDIDTGATILKNGSTPILHTGKGVQADLYVVPSVAAGGAPRTFLTSRYTYAAEAIEDTTRNTNGTYTLTFRINGTDHSVNIANEMKIGTVFLYTKYGVEGDRDAVRNAQVGYELLAATGTETLGAPQVFDASSVKVATQKNVEVTNSYIPNKDDVTTGYFRTADGKFEYSASYGAKGTRTIVSNHPDVLGGHAMTNWYNLEDVDLAASLGNASAYGTINDGSILGDLMLDREELVKARWTQQTLYFDDFGYVIHTERVAAAEKKAGYMILTGGTYAAKDNDNLFYANYVGFDHEAKQFSIQGGWLTSYYNTQAEASDGLALNQGIYRYEIDVTGKYSLNSNVATNESGANVHAVGNRDEIITVIGAQSSKDIGVDAGNRYNAYLNGNAKVNTIDEIRAGDVDALDVDGADVLMDNETIFVVAEYNQYGAITGYKSYKGIKNIPDMADGGYTGANSVRVPFVAHYTTAVDQDAAIDLVLVLGAVCYADSVETVYNDDLFFLADLTPDEKFTEFDRHDIFKAGQAGTLDFVNETIRNSNGTFNEPVASNGLGVYTIEARRGGLVSRIAAAQAASTEAKWVGKNIIKATGYLGFDELSGSTEYDLDNDYIVLADDCKIFVVHPTLGTCRAITMDQAASIANTENSRKSAIDGNDTVYVGAYNQYGFATALYVVVNEDPV